MHTRFTLEGVMEADNLEVLG